jgi:YHS domain-containing protein
VKQFPFLFVLVAGLLLAGCSSPAPDAKTEPAIQENATATSTEAPSSELVAFRKDGKLVCPMMGSEIKDEASAVGHVDYEGVRYYLCCDMCVEPAKKDPKAMAEKAAKL